MTILEHIYKLYRKVKDLGKKICCLDERVDLLEGEATVGVINGLSANVDNEATLGQDVGAVGNPAVLLSDREIPAAGNTVGFTTNTDSAWDAITFDNSSANAAARAQIKFINNSDLTGTLGIGSSTSTSYPSFIYLATETTAAGLFLHASGTGIIRFGTATEGSAGEKVRILNNGNTVIGTPFTDNTAKLRVNGTFTTRRFVQAAPAGYSILSSGDDFKVFTNEGATAQAIFDLPAATAGSTHTFIVQDTDGILITAVAGDTIRVGATVSTAGGTLSSATIGNSVTLVAINTTEWIATSVIGTWTAA